jgi:hypothetical protein
MKKKSRVLKDILIDYVRLYYLGVLNDREIKNAISIFELLLDDEINVEDFIPIIRQMQFDLDTVLA